MKFWNKKLLPKKPDSENGHVIKLNGKQTHYLKTGSGEALILIHGYFYDHRMWDFNREELVKHYTVYEPDLWGCGLSTREQMEYNYELFCEQIKLFMEHLGLKSALFCGQGMGAGTIMKLAADYPEKVKKMILIDSAGLPDDIPLTAKILRSTIVGTTLFSLPGSFIRRHILKKHFMKHINRHSNEVFDRIVEFHQIKGTTQCLLRMVQADFFHSLEETIKELSHSKTPKLIIWGEDDNSNPLEQGKKLHEYLSGSEFIVIPDAAHISNADQPEKFNQVAIDFLKK